VSHKAHYNTLNYGYSLASKKKKDLRIGKFTAVPSQPALILSAQTVAQGMDFFLSTLLFAPKYWLK
jgi:hypothetical protein